MRVRARHAPVRQRCCPWFVAPRRVDAKPMVASFQALRLAGVARFASKGTYALFTSASAFAAAAASPSEIKSLHAAVVNEYHEVLKRHGVEASAFQRNRFPLL